MGGHAPRREHGGGRIPAADLPPKAAELSVEISEWADVFHPGIRLDLVVIDDDRNLIQAQFGGRRQRLPDLALLKLAVPRSNI